MKLNPTPVKFVGGWAGMTRERLDSEVDAELIAYAEAQIFELPAAPHTWLFPRSLVGK